MKAVVVSRACRADELRLSEVPVPSVRPGWVLVRVRAFGVNHSEVLFRQFEAEAPYIRLPRVPGIECAGEIADPSDSSFRQGERVVALMGGMGRSFDGSYAEYALLPAHHVFPVSCDLPWEELAAIPESFYTAYGSLFVSMRTRPGDTLLVRGASSTVGLAAVQLASAEGVEVVATTRQRRKAGALVAAGAARVEIDDGTLPERVGGIDKVLELVGASTLRESLRMARRHGEVCYTGILGGKFSLDGFDPIKDIPSGVFLTGFYSNNPTPAEIADMFSRVSRAGIRPVVAATLPLSEIAEAHRLAEEGGLIGKIVVTCG